MTKDVKGFQIFYSKMIHVMYLEHGLHKVVEEVQSDYPNIGTLMFLKRKKIFLKASLRVQKMKETAPTLPLPPQTVCTCWETWLMLFTITAQIMIPLRV